MTPIAHKLMKRVSAHGRGKWVCTPRDFLDLGSRAAVDQALSRLVKAGRLRRVGHGLYDMPRMSTVLKRDAPVDLDAAITALGRRDGVRIVPDGLVAANQLGLTTAVPAQVSYVTDGATRTLKSAGGRSGFAMRALASCGGPAHQRLPWCRPCGGLAPTMPLTPKSFRR